MGDDGYRMLLLDDKHHSLLIVNGPSGNIIAELSLPAGFTPIDLIMTSDNALAYIPLTGDGDEGRLCRLSIPEKTLRKLPYTLPNPSQFAVSPNGTTAFLASPAGDVYCLELETGGLTKWDQPVPGGTCVAMAALDDRLYTVWEVAGGGVLASLHTDGSLQEAHRIEGIPTDITLTPDGGVIVPFAAGETGDGIFIINPKNDGIPTVVTLQCQRCISRAYPSHAVIDADGNTAYVVCEDLATIVIVDLVSNSAIGAIPLGRSISRLALLPGGNSAIGSSRLTSDLTLIDLTNRRVTAVTSCGRKLQAALAVIN